MELQKLDQPNITQSINIFENASNLKLTEEETNKLLAPFDEKMIEIRPDGLIYLPQVFWRQRLNTSIGIGQWALIVKGQHKDPDPNKDKLYVEGVLMIRGAYVATAVGEAELHTDNKNQSWASVWESAKSDCITRCCKDVGIASELWQPEFINKWVEKYAIQVWVEGKNKPQWRKATSAPFYKETGLVKKNAPVGDSKSVPAAEKKTGLQGQSAKPWLNPGTKEWDNAFQKIHTGAIDMDGVLQHYRLSKENQKNLLNPKFIHDQIK